MFDDKTLNVVVSLSLLKVLTYNSLGNVMSTIHPKLIEIVVEQTPRAMIAMLIVSSTYFLIFIKFVPLIYLLIWLAFQLLLAVCRFYNAKTLKKSLQQQAQRIIKKNEMIFILLNIFQAITWTMASILVMLYAPHPFEFVMFVVIIGIVTAATLSMSSFYKAYLVFFFLMIIPQIILMLNYGEYQHIALVAFTIIYIPATILLSKAILMSRLSSIEAHDELAKNAEEFRKLSMIDNLTNIYNRGCFFEMSQNIILLAAREQKKVSLLMLDIDYFKFINDKYGHHAGDYILINLVKKIKDSMRKSDVFARIGGEEFAIILCNTSLYGADIFAEKIRVMIENSTFIYDSIPIKITISIGISEVQKENVLIEDLYKAADKQLYAAKESGRNRICYTGKL